MQVVKQPEHGKASTTKERKWTKDEQKEQKTSKPPSNKRRTMINNYNSKRFVNGIKSV